MKIKVFTPNHSGKIEFTPAELEKLLNEVYTDGQNNCNCGKTITWTNPYLNQPMCYQDEKTIATSATSNDESACECANPQRKAYTATFNINSEDAKEMSKHIDEIIKNATARIDNDAFSKLAKELNF
jgi:hypothetical protein